MTDGPDVGGVDEELEGVLGRSPGGRESGLLLPLQLPHPFLTVRREPELTQGAHPNAHTRTRMPPVVGRVGGGRVASGKWREERGGEERGEGVCPTKSCTRGRVCVEKTGQKFGNERSLAEEHTRTHADHEVTVKTRGGRRVEEWPRQTTSQRWSRGGENTETNLGVLRCRPQKQHTPVKGVRFLSRTSFL